MIDRSLITFITAGDPEPECTVEFLKAMDTYADILELGIPTTDPMADGPTIQKANYRALKNDLKLDDIFRMVDEFRNTSDTPIILMTYYNPIYRKGIDEFMKRANEAGVNGTIVVDLPIDESKGYLQACSEYDVDHVFLASPNTGDERLKEIDKVSSFVYLTSSYSTTGTRGSISSLTYVALDNAKQVCNKPVAVGFGISTEDHVRDLLQAGADGIVVGSAIVRLIEEYGSEAVEKIEKKVGELKRPFH